MFVYQGPGGPEPAPAERVRVMSDGPSAVHHWLRSQLHDERLTVREKAVVRNAWGAMVASENRLGLVPMADVAGRMAA